VNQGSDEALDSDGHLFTHRSDPVMLAAGENNSDVDFGFYKKHCGYHFPKWKKGFGLHHFFGKGHQYLKRDGSSGHHKRFDWSGKLAQSESWHETKMQAGSSWLKKFVCDLKSSDPNKDIEISLSKKGDKDYKKPRKRRR
jgi:hypothetical protein